MPTGVLVLLPLVVLSCAACGDGGSPKKPADRSTQGKERVCPDAWYFDAMPGPSDAGSDQPREYLVVDGERRELTEFDLEWIRENCEVNGPETVQ